MVFVLSLVFTSDGVEVGIGVAVGDGDGDGVGVGVGVGVVSGVVRASDLVKIKPSSRKQSSDSAYDSGAYDLV